MGTWNGSVGCYEFSSFIWAGEFSENETRYLDLKIDSSKASKPSLSTLVAT
jgi:hypothetical protein